MGLIVRRVDALEPLAREWNALAPAHPFQTWEWAMCWWKHLRARSLGVRDTLYAFALRDETGALVAAAPMMRTLRPGLGVAMVRVAQFFGADPNLTELRGLACRPGAEAEATRALMEELQRRRGEWDWLEWGGIRDQGPVSAVLEGTPGLEWLKHQPEYVLPLATSWEEQRARLGRNLKESLRKCYNSLKRDGLSAELRVASTGAEIAAALPRLIELHALRARLEATVRHNDVFATPGARSFLPDVCGRLAERGICRVFQLMVGGQVVAARLGFVHGSQLYLYYSGFDPAFGKYSVMTTTLAEAVQWAIRAGLRTVDLSFGTDVSKTRWDPEERLWRRAVFASPTLRSRLARHTYLGLGRLAGEALRRLLGRPQG